jgi:hypothetical protein
VDPTVIFSPGTLTLVALAVGGASPFGLLALSPLSGWSPGARFDCASGVALVFFWAVCFVVRHETDPNEMAAASALLAAAITFWLLPWSLLAWGLTITLLTCLAQGRGPLTADQLRAAYIADHPAHTLMENRLQILLRTGLVKRRGGMIVVTGLGMGVALLARGIKILAGIR